MYEEIAPCPLCGGKGVLYELGKYEHIIQCENCGLTTARCELKERARQMWEGKVRVKTWSKAVIPWKPLNTTEEEQFSEEETGSKKITDTKIEMLDISTRLRHLLIRNRYNTVGDIVKSSPQKIKHIRKMGPHAYKELSDKLEKILEKDVYDKWLRKEKKI
ncbi:MAG: hypothetical protein E7200_05230 [Selenomonas ruminantium]|nr:hypothetical protein [Selenomonas ruminantium]